MALYNALGGHIMKKIVIIFAIAFLAIGTLSAQVWGQRQIPESTKIDGTLQLHNGQFAVASGNNIYYVPRIGHYAGFIDGLKEGANVSFEGFVSGNFLMPVKMTISGKTYDLAPGPERNKDFLNRNNRDRKDWGMNDRGFNRFGPCCGPYGGNGWNNRGRR
jgi:hypothetical protein